MASGIDCNPEQIDIAQIWAAEKGYELFVNFLTVNDFRCGEGGDLGQNQYEQFDDDLPVIHSYYTATEPDELFSGMKLLYKEDRVLQRIYDGQLITQGFVDYIVQKPLR
ncbi:hypothetical protein D3C73_1385710 [compost metagenome]